MKHMLAILALATLTTPAIAEEEAERGLNLMEEGAQLLLRGLMQEMEPAIDELQGFAEDLGPAMDQFSREMGPILADILKRVDDISNYRPPEFLPNGDIIMRRKKDAPLFDPDADDSIEL